MCTFSRAQLPLKTTPEEIAYVAKFYDISEERAKDLLTRPVQYPRNRAGTLAYIKPLMESEESKEFQKLCDKYGRTWG